MSDLQEIDQAVAALTPVQQRELAVKLAAEGKQPHDVCAALNVSPSTLWRWQQADATFKAEWSQAREVGMHSLAGQLVTIPDECQDVNKARLKSDNIKWLVSRLLAKYYGDRIDVNLNQQIDLGSTLIEARKRTLQPMCNLADVQDTQVIDVAYESVAQPTDKESDDGPDIFA